MCTCVLTHVAQHWGLVFQLCESLRFPSHLKSADQLTSHFAVTIPPTRGHRSLLTGLCWADVCFSLSFCSGVTSEERIFETSQVDYIPQSLFKFFSQPLSPYAFCYFIYFLFLFLFFSLSRKKAHFLRHSMAMLSCLVLNRWAQATFLPQPPKLLCLKASFSMPGSEGTMKCRYRIDF